MKVTHDNVAPKIGLITQPCLAKTACYFTTIVEVQP